MAEPTRGLLDTAVVVDHDVVDPDLLPDESANSAVTLAELAAGPHAATWDALSFDVEAARAYGRVFAATRRAGRSARARLADLLIASAAVANGLPLYTRNPTDFVGLEDIVKVVAV